MSRQLDAADRPTSVTCSGDPTLTTTYVYDTTTTAGTFPIGRLSSIAKGSTNVSYCPPVALRAHPARRRPRLELRRQRQPRLDRPSRQRDRLLHLRHRRSPSRAVLSTAAGASPAPAPRYSSPASTTGAPRSTWPPALFKPSTWRTGSPRLTPLTNATIRSRHHLRDTPELDLRHRCGRQHHRHQSRPHLHLSGLPVLPHPGQCRHSLGHSRLDLRHSRQPADGEPRYRHSGHVQLPDQLRLAHGDTPSLKTIALASSAGTKYLTYDAAQRAPGSGPTSHSTSTLTPPPSSAR